MTSSVVVQLLDPARFAIDISAVGLTIDDAARLTGARPEAVHEFIEEGRPISVSLQRQLTFLLYALETAADAGADLRAMDLKEWLRKFNSLRSPEELEFTIRQMIEAGEYEGGERVSTNSPRDR